MKTIIFLLLSFVGCAELGITPPFPMTQKQSGGVGFTAGLVTAKTVQKIKEELEPVYKMGIYPQQVCYKENQMIHCYIVPCMYEEITIQDECVLSRSEDVFWEEEVFVLGQSLANISYIEVIERCKRVPEECVEIAAIFDGSTVMVLK